GLNLCGFAYNDGVNAVDDLGLGVIYFQNANGTAVFKYTTPPETSGLSRLWNGNGNAKPKPKGSRCNECCEELKQLLMKAYVAADVYANVDGREDVPGAPNYQRLSNAQLKALGLDPALFIKDEYSFYSALYFNRMDKTYLYALRGTQERYDWISDGKQGLG